MHVHVVHVVTSDALRSACVLLGVHMWPGRWVQASSSRNVPMFFKAHSGHVQLPAERMGLDRALNQIGMVPGGHELLELDFFLLGQSPSLYLSEPRQAWEAGDDGSCSPPLHSHC